MTSTEQNKPAGPGPLAAAAKLRVVNEQYDRELFEAKEKGRLVAYLTSMVPVEILQAFSDDIVVAMPENYAALCNSRKMAAEFCDTCERYGYSGDICSYVLTSFGSELDDRGPYDGRSLPDPDLLIATDYACNTHVKWWQNLADHYNVPLFVVDGAYTVDGSLGEYHKKYQVSEFKGLISFLEEHTGKKLDIDRFREVVALSDKAGALWCEIGEYRKAIPAPIGAIDVFTLMLNLVLMRGTQEAVDFYQEVVDEIKERVKNKVAAVPNERFRLVWDLFPIWHRLRLLKLFEDAGAIIVTDLYADAFGGRLNPEDPFNSMAERYLCQFTMTTSRGHSELYKRRLKEWNVDGMVIHLNRACRFATIPSLRMAQILENETGIPIMMFEGNMADPRTYSEAQVVTRIQAFIELLEASKYGALRKN